MRAGIAGVAALGVCVIACSTEGAYFHLDGLHYEASSPLTEEFEGTITFSYDASTSKFVIDYLSAVVGTLAFFEGELRYERGFLVSGHFTFGNTEGDEVEGVRVSGGVSKLRGDAGTGFTADRYGVGFRMYTPGGDQLWGQMDVSNHSTTAGSEYGWGTPFIPSGNLWYSGGQSGVAGMIITSPGIPLPSAAALGLAGIGIVAGSRRRG